MKPKRTPQIEQAMKRLQSDLAFQAYTAYQRDVLEHLKNTLVTSPVAALPEIQGRAKQLQELLDEFKDLK